MALVLAGFFMTLLDTTIVNVAIPSIQANLAASNSSIEWVVSGYALAFALTLIPGGRLGDRFGRRRLFVLSLAGFTVMSLLCGLATSSGELVGFRVAQGAAAGMLNPQVLAFIQITFLPRERGKAFAFYGATAGVSTALGPLLGGLLISADLGGLDWRPIFFLNVVIGIPAMLAALRLLPESKGRGGDLDPVGVGLISVALVLVVYPLVEGRQAGWPAWAIAALAAAAPALAVFVLWQRRRIRAGSPPLVDIRLFRHRAFTAGVALVIAYFAGFTSVFFTLSLWLQIGLGRSALAAGLTILPFAVGSLAGSLSSHVAARRFGPRILQIGTGMVVIGFATTLMTVHLRGAGTPGPLLLPSLAFAGIGSGLTIAPNTNLVLARVPGQDAGAAGGVLSTAQRVGTAVGIAVVGMLLFGSLGGGATSAATAATPALRHQLAAANVPAADRHHAVQHFTACFQRRASSIDPGAQIPSCHEPSKASQHRAVPRAIARASRTALARDFSRALQASLLFNLAAVALAFLLVFGFPRRAGPPGPHREERA
jgi:EmrB/QacA subfamily drug resistance transporter